MKFQRILLIGFILFCCASYVFPSFLSNSYNGTTENILTKEHSNNAISSIPNMVSFPTNVNSINTSSIKTHSENINSINNNLTTNVKELVDPFRFYLSEPAPMGLCDFGINPSINESYSYNTTSFLGTAKVYSLSVGGGSSMGCVGIQLNVELKFTVNSSTYVYWLQNIAKICTTTQQLSFWNDIWNWSSPGAIMIPTGLIGRGSVNNDSSGVYYKAYSLLSYTQTYPNTFQMKITSSQTNDGEPTVAFEYKNGDGNWIAYDNVTFLTQSEPVNDMNLVVDGSDYTPSNYYYDAEFVLCGNYNLQTAIAQSDTKLDLQLEYYNGDIFQPIPHVYNFGSNTGETISNIVVTPYNYTNGGNFYVELTDGSGNYLGPLENMTHPFSSWWIVGVIGTPVLSVVIFLVVYLSLKHKKNNLKNFKKSGNNGN